MRVEGQIYKTASDIFILPRDFIVTFQSSMMILPHFFTLKDHY